MAINAAQVSQSLDMDYAILEENIEKMDSLHYIVLAVSYPTLFFTLEHSLERWRLPYYRYYGIDTGFERSDKPILFQDAMRNNIKRIKDYYITKDDPARRMTRQGLIALDSIQSGDALMVKAIEVSDRHTVRHLNRPLLEKNIGYLMKIVDLAQNKKIKVVMVTLPFHTYYRERLYKKQVDIIDAVMTDLSDSTNVFYYDMNDLGAYDRLKYFYDGNHLSSIGARRVSLQLDSIIRSLPAE